MPYNGHKNWNHWNVYTWLTATEGDYRMVCDCIRRTRTLDDAARRILDLVGHGESTPDGAPYTFTSIRAALVGWV